MKKRVVITGMDIVSSIGTGLEEFWQAASKGVSGIKRIQTYDPSPYPTQIAGQIPMCALDALPEFDQPKRYPKAARFALFCAQAAIAQSGLEQTELRLAGTFIGTSSGGTPELESAYSLFYEGQWKKVPALSIIRGMPNSIANHIAITFGLGGSNSTISNACVSSAEAIGMAYQQISQGKLNIAICGGTESLIWETIMAAWCKLKIMSTENTYPELACRPFDLNRSGMVMAEGAGILILEDYKHAKARGAKILAEIIGYGASCDAHHITMPLSSGQTRAIYAALDDARLASSDVQYISAHGTGTQINDLIETKTFKTVFGKNAPFIPITAQKAMTGHTIGAAGAMQIIGLTLSLQNQLLLPTINLHHPDPNCDLDYTPNQARPKSVDIALSTHFAFGGANAALILQRH